MMDDLISRRDAINAVSEITTTMSVCTNKDECCGMKRMQKQAITELANLPSAEPEQTAMIKEIRRWINSGNRGNADYFIVDRIEEIINAYEIN